jgi:hypothetical protein
MQLVNRVRTALAILTLAAGAITTVASPTAGLVAQTGPANHPTLNVPQ